MSWRNLPGKLQNKIKDKLPKQDREAVKNMAKSNLGMQFEELIINSNKQYQGRSHNRTMIDKIATEWKPLRGEKGKIVGAKVETESTVDFVGRHNGIPIAFDAKSTNEKRLPLRNIKQHQVEFLRDWISDGVSVGFLLWGINVGFNDQRYFVIPVHQILHAFTRYKQGGRASIALEEMLPEWEVKGGALLNSGNRSVALDYLSVVEKVLMRDNV